MTRPLALGADVSTVQPAAVITSKKDNAAGTHLFKNPFLITFLL
jgi:hypothetical protein